MSSFSRLMLRIMPEVALCQCCGIVFWDTVIVPSSCVIHHDVSDA